MNTVSGDPMLKGLVVATMFRGDPYQLVQWSNIHLNSGADRIYVVLDRPSASLTELLPDDPNIEYVPIPEATWDRYYSPGAANVERRQVDAMRWIMRRAHADGHEFLAFIDADEVLDLEVPFTKLSELYPDASALTPVPREMWFEESGAITDPFGATLALGPASGGVDWRRAFGWRAQYLRKGMLGHDAGKSIYRLPLASGAISVHCPLNGILHQRSVLLPREQARLLHFDCGSVSTWNAKWASRLSGQTHAAALGGHRRAQQLLFQRALRLPADKQTAFFERFFTLDEAAVDFLGAEGLMERVAFSTQVRATPTPGYEMPVSAAVGPLAQLQHFEDAVDHQYALVCDSNFVRPTLATMLSVLAQTSPHKRVRFVLLGDGLSAADESMLRRAESCEHSVEVRIHDVTADLDRDVGKDEHKRARATYGRVYLVDFLPEQRTIYLDGDILATRDLSELFEMDLEDDCLAGVPDSAALRIVDDPSSVPAQQVLRIQGITRGEPLEYLNAGVLVHNLEHHDYRELALTARAHVAMEGRALAQHDQDALNLAFSGRKRRLPSSFNYMTQFYTSERSAGGDLVDLKYAAADASLIHFSGKVKPWLSREDEFYNGLYRRLVASAESMLGVDCGLYFSQSRATAKYRTFEEWSTDLRPPVTPRGVARVSPRESDLEFIDITDYGLYLRCAADTYTHLVTQDLRLQGRSRDAQVFDIPLSALSMVQTHLAERVGPGVRFLPIDLPKTLSGVGGRTSHLELVIGPAEDTASDEFVRSLGMIDSLATKAAQDAADMATCGAAGQVEKFADGILTGWYDAPKGQAVALHIGGELVARRIPPRTDDSIRRSFKFRVASLVASGYGEPDDTISVCLSGTNMAIPGKAITVSQVHSAAAAATTLTQQAVPKSRTLRTHAGRVARRLRARLS